MSSSNLLKNIISKDINTQTKAIKNLINSANLEDFKEICKNSDFIFPYVREKFIKNFIKLINKNDLETIFKFSSVYSYEFEDIIVKSWVKFADEDLTDRILELFEVGTLEQKAYCAKYFSHIKDTLSLELLKTNAFCDYEPLKLNCAVALSQFKDEEILSEMKNIIKTSENEFDKIEAYKFLCAYNSIESVDFVLKNYYKSPFRVHIVSYLLDFYEFDTLVNNYNSETISKMFHILLEGYPEDLSLETIEYYRIYDFINYLLNNINSYSNNLLLIAKSDFREYFLNENYQFNLDKNAKEELRQINNLLKNFKEDFSTSSFLLEDEDIDCFKSALKVIEEYKLTNYSDKLGSLINGKEISEERKALIAQTLKSMNKQNLIQKEAIQNIENKNVKILIESLMV